LPEPEHNREPENLFSCTDIPTRREKSMIPRVIPKRVRVWIRFNDFFTDNLLGFNRLNPDVFSRVHHDLFLSAIGLDYTID